MSHGNYKEKEGSNGKETQLGCVHFPMSSSRIWGLNLPWLMWHGSENMTMAVKGM